MIHMVFTTEGLFEVAIESWPEWDLNLRDICIKYLYKYIYIIYMYINYISTIHIYIHTYILIYMYMYVYTYIYIYIHIYTYTHTHTHTHTHMHTHTHTHICKYLTCAVELSLLSFFHTCQVYAFVCVNVRYQMLLFASIGQKKILAELSSS